MSTHAPNTWLELNASALDHNIRQYKKVIGNCKLAFVVKTNAYGHGIDQIIQLTHNNSAISWYCTFSLSEAIYLRSIGVTKQILVLGLIDQDPAIACKKQIDLMISDMQQLTLVSQAAQQSNCKARIHIKIDTGLSRFGFLPEEAFTLIQKIHNASNIDLQGISTHFAAAEEDDQTYTRWQMDQFHWLIVALAKYGINIPYKHSHASSAVIRCSLEHTNLVRIGAGIYGLWSSDKIKKEALDNHKVNLKQIATWKSYISSIRTLKKGSKVGYGGSYTTQAQKRIAIIPVGYADGYPRRLSNIGKVFVNDQYAPVIGRVAMNVITIDVTHIPSAQIESEVILMGDYPALTALELAQQIGSYNPREVTISLANSMERRIVSDHILRYTKPPSIQAI